MSAKGGIANPLNSPVPSSARSGGQLLWESSHPGGLLGLVQFGPTTSTTIALGPRKYPSAELDPAGLSHPADIPFSLLRIKESQSNLCWEEP